MIRVILVDDEQPSLDRMEKLVRASGLAEVKGKFTEPLKALDFLKENQADVIFLDIEMPDMDGIEFATCILDFQAHIEVVFVTAYNQYAVEAFRLNALDYLMKPVSAERLEKTLHRILENKGATPCEELSIQCFGRFRVSSGTKEVRFRTEKAEELFAYLIDNGGGFVSRSKIIDSLWEDFEGDRAITHFNTTLHYVKKSLLLYGIKVSVQYDRGVYKMDTEGVNCDYLKFSSFPGREEAVTKENISRFEEAIGLYGGEYLLGWEYNWVAAKRLMLENKYIRLLLAMAEYYRKNENYQSAAGWLEKGLLHEPLHRELNYRLVEILLLDHNRAMAIKYYELYRRNLMRRLGEEPDDAFRKLLR